MVKAVSFLVLSFVRRNLRGAHGRVKRQSPDLDAKGKERQFANSGEETPMSTSDIVEIEQLLHRYCLAVDKGAPEDVAALFSETAVLVPVYTGEAPAKGRAAVLQWYMNYKKGTRAAVDHLRHVVTNPVIEVSGDHATSECYLTANSVSKTTGKASWVAGGYKDKLVKEHGRWRFAEREILVQYATESATR
jgi:hypothetical protein